MDVDVTVLVLVNAITVVALILQIAVKAITLSTRLDVIVCIIVHIIIFRLRVVSIAFDLVRLWARAVLSLIRALIRSTVLLCVAPLLQLVWSASKEGAYPIVTPA